MTSHQQAALRTYIELFSRRKALSLSRPRSPWGKGKIAGTAADSTAPPSHRLSYRLSDEGCDGRYLPQVARRLRTAERKGVVAGYGIGENWLARLFGPYQFIPANWLRKHMAPFG